MRKVDLTFDIGMDMGVILSLRTKVTSLYQEMQILRKLNHKHILRWYGMINSKVSVSLLMEYMKVGSIYDLISRQGALQEKVISKFCKEILEGLAYLHEKKIVHRNLKCSNILLDDWNNCKLTGFCMSKQAENITPISGRFDEIASAYWMSPECLTGNKYGWETDIWSLGCTLLEMLNTKPPYGESSRAAAISSIVNRILIPTFPPGTTNHCMEFVKVCLQKEPRHRPSAKDLLDYKFISMQNEY